MIAESPTRHADAATRISWRRTRAVSSSRKLGAERWSLVCDALSFIVMKRLRITDAIGFDRHVRQYGRFNLLA